MARVPDTATKAAAEEEHKEGTEVTYDPPDDEAEEVTWRGQLFQKGKAVYWGLLRVLR